MKKVTLFTSLFFLLACSYLNAQKTIEFESEDGLNITADLYPKKGAESYIILFHQAGWSRGEYKEIAPRLNARGYTCIAVDLRSGGEINGVINQTHKNAIAAGESTDFVDAYQDMKAAISYVRNELKAEKIIIWGSSYSSSLVLKYGGDYSNEIDAMVSFSPGEYFDDKLFITKSASNITKPVFITSAKNEKEDWEPIYNVIPATNKTAFLPQTNGNHGSRSLWAQFEDHTAYWAAIDAFLAGL